MTDAAGVIAAGGQPEWSGSYDHPEHGQLTFTAKLPTNRDWLRHAMTQEGIAPGLGGTQSGTFAAAIAGLLTIIQCPVISETRDEDAEDPDHVTVTQIRYDPLEDTDLAFPVKVWVDFFNWRAGLLSDEGKEQVKNSSGATSGSVTADSSPDPTASPSTTLA